MNYGLMKKGVKGLAKKLTFANKKNHQERWDDQQTAGEE